MRNTISGFFAGLPGDERATHPERSSCNERKLPMKVNQSFPLFLSLLVFPYCGCGGGSIGGGTGGGVVGQVTTTVYIAGGSYNVNNGSSQVYQWTNGVSSPVPGGVTGYDPGANTWSIAASGSNVYMAGDGYDNATQNYTAMSSNNGTITDLTDGTVNASANAVAVSGSDVYGRAPNTTAQPATTSRCIGITARSPISRMVQ